MVTKAEGSLAASSGDEKKKERLLQRIQRQAVVRLRPPMDKQVRSGRQIEKR